MACLDQVNALRDTEVLTLQDRLLRRSLSGASRIGLSRFTLVPPVCYAGGGELAGSGAALRPVLPL